MTLPLKWNSWWIIRRPDLHLGLQASFGQGILMVRAAHASSFGNEISHASVRFSPISLFSRELWCPAIWERLVLGLIGFLLGRWRTLQIGFHVADARRRHLNSKVSVWS